MSHIMFLLSLLAIRLTHAEDECRSNECPVQVNALLQSSQQGIHKKGKMQSQAATSGCNGQKWSDPLMDRKCKYQHEDRLWRLEQVSVDECKAKCDNVEECHAFSYGSHAGKQVCMGCKDENQIEPDVHAGFRFWRECSETTTTTAQGDVQCDDTCYTKKGALNPSKQCGKKKCKGCCECNGGGCIDKTDLEEDENAREVTDENQVTYECATWCYSKKHQSKPWQEKKCGWYGCSTCPECDAACSMGDPISGRSPGSSMGQTTKQSLEECQDFCLEDDSCLAITYRADSGACWRLDRSYDGKYEEASDDCVVANKACQSTTTEQAVETCELGCDNCGYNWYEQQYNGGSPSNWWNNNTCDCCVIGHPGENSKTSQKFQACKTTCTQAHSLVQTEENAQLEGDK